MQSKESKTLSIRLINVNISNTWSQSMEDVAIAIVKITFRKLSPVLKKHHYESMNTKTGALKVYVSSVLLFGCGGWTLNNDSNNKLEAVEMGFLRIIQRISWTEKSHHEVLALTKQRKALITTMRQRRVNSQDV